MAKAAPKAKTKAEEPVDEEEAEAKSSKKSKATPDFDSVQVMTLAKDYAETAKAGLDEFGVKIKDMLTKAEADPKTYRDVITTVKFVERRVERMGLSITELTAGLKERAPRAEKPEAPAKAEKPAKAKAAPKGKAKPAADDDDDEELDLDDE